MQNKKFTIVCFICFVLMSCTGQIPQSSVAPYIPDVEKQEIKSETIVDYSRKILITNHLPEEISKESLIYWGIEAYDALKKPIYIVAGHGVRSSDTFMFMSDQGIAVSLQLYAESAKEFFPDRAIVFIVCNNNGYTLEGKDIWYSEKIVSIIPDSFYVGETPRQDEYPDMVTKFEQFVEGK